MNRILLGVFFSFLLGCRPFLVVKNGQANVGNQQDQYLVWVQANNQINSRIAQDRFVREWPKKAVQGYLFTKTNRLSSENAESWKNQMLEEGYNKVLLVLLKDSVNTITLSDPSLKSRNWINDYLKFCDSLAYNPIYELKFSNGFCIETLCYDLKSGDLRSQTISKRVFNLQFLEALDQNTMALKKLIH